MLSNSIRTRILLAVTYCDRAVLFVFSLLYDNKRPLCQCHYFNDWYLDIFQVLSIINGIRCTNDVLILFSTSFMCVGLIVSPLFQDENTIDKRF